jgi:hypothetical protein
LPGGDRTPSPGVHRALSERIAADVVEADPVAEAVRKLAEAAGTWQGTASELLAKLTAELGEHRPPRSWPATPKGMTAALTRVAPALRQVGVRVEQAGRQGHDRQRVWGLSVDPAAHAPAGIPPLGLDAATNPPGPQAGGRDRPHRPHRPPPSIRPAQRARTRLMGCGRLRGRLPSSLRNRPHTRRGRIETRPGNRPVRRCAREDPSSRYRQPSAAMTLRTAGSSASGTRSAGRSLW